MNSMYLTSSRGSYPIRLATAFFSHWRLAASVFLLFISLALALAFLSKDQYRCQMKFLVKNERVAPLVSTDQNTTSLLYRNDISEAKINSEIELLTSTDLLRKIAEKRNLFSIEGQRGGSTSESLKQLQKALSVKSVRKSNIIEVTYHSGDPQQSLDVLKSMASLYLDSHLLLNGSPGAFDFFDAQANASQQKLTQAESELAKFRSLHNIVALPEEKNLALQKVASLEKELFQRQALAVSETKHESSLQKQIVQVEPRITKEIRVIPNQYSVERLNTLLVELRNKHTEVVSKYQPNERIVVQLEQQISETEKALENAIKLSALEKTTDINPLFQLLDSELNRTKAALAGAFAARDVLSDQLAENRKHLKTLDQITAAHDTMVRQVKELEDTYLMYSRKREESRVGELLDKQRIANVVIAEQPFLPEKPSSPNRPLILSLGALWALLASVATLFIAAHLTDKLSNPAEIESAVGISVLATIPASSRFSVPAGTSWNTFLLGSSK